MSDVPSTFQGKMAFNLAAHYDIRGAVIYEIGSDPDLSAAKALIRKGARFVLATNLGRNWAREPATDVVPITCDVRNARSLVGQKSVDAVFGINVLEHISDLPIALEAIHDILKPGGCFLLHGHPLWSCSTGHHSFWIRDDERYVFGEGNDPLPPFAHLYMSERDILMHLLNGGVSAGAAIHITEFALRSDELNRKPLPAIVADFRDSGLIVEKKNTDRGPTPDEVTMQRIKSGPWALTPEQHAVRQVTYLGRA
jgi:SAM-dependent methyltransferase